MAFDILYPVDGAQVHRHSSIDQFRDFLSIMTKGGWTPIVFDQLDGITCQTIFSHPIIISFNNDIGFIFPEAHCTYASDHFVFFNKEGVEEKVLSPCFGEGGDFYMDYVRENTFINFDSNDSIGTHNKKQLRTGLSYVLADETLPPVD